MGGFYTEEMSQNCYQVWFRTEYRCCVKGLILSGGHGVRLRPLTYSQQKQLIPVANKPILFYCIEDLISAGIHSIGIIVGPNKEQVMETVNSVQWDASFEFITQDSPAGLAHAVLTAKPYLGDDDFVMYLGDNLLMGGINHFIRDFSGSDVDASILLTHVSNPEQFGVALVDEQKKVIVKLLEKPKNPPSNLSIVGVYGLTPAIFEAIEHIKPSWRGELEITDALDWLITNKYTVRYSMVEGWWKDTGKPEDLLEANRLILDCMKTRNLGTIEGSRVSGRLNVGMNTVIKNNSMIKGPVIIGEGCVISNSYIGPYTSIGNGSSIENAHIEDSIVMDNARIQDVDRIIESLIGRNVIIEKQSALPGGRRFFVGDSSHVML
jgi:glucose-1-phosphate thymidylyltransferase